MGTPAPLGLVKLAHKRAVFERRIRVLSNHLGQRIPSGSSVLDVGCGDGAIANLLNTGDASLQIRGIELSARAKCLIKCEVFDGSSIPYPSESFDVCMFVDVLHHLSSTQAIAGLLAEACRVTRRFVLIKDHLAENQFDYKTLQIMDWVGNRPHGVVLPYNYLGRSQWDSLFARSSLNVCYWNQKLSLYPFPFGVLFDRKLHFIALLEKANDANQPSRV